MIVTNDFFNISIIDSFLPEIISELQSIIIPDISFTEDIGIERVQIQLTGLTIDGVTIGTAEVQLIPSFGGYVDIDGFALRLTGEWTYKLLTYPYTYEGGDLIISCDNSSGTLGIKIGTSSYPYSIVISLDSVNINVSDLSIQFEGAGTLVNTLFTVIEPMVELEIDSIIGEAIQIVADEIFEGFNGTLIKEGIGDYVYLIDQLSDLLVVESYYASLPLAGLFMNCSDVDDTLPDFNPGPIPSIFTDASVQHFFSIDSVRSQYYAVFGALLNGKIGPFSVTYSESNPDDASVLSILPFSLTSSDLSQFIPEVNDLCTSSPCDIDITFDLTDQPYSLVMTSYSFVSDWNSLNIKLTGSNSSYIEMFVEMELEHVLYPDHKHWDIMQMFNLKQLSSFSIVDGSIEIVNSSKSLLLLAILTSVLLWATIWNLDTTPNLVLISPLMTTFSSQLVV
ncbi:BPI/LBP/Plunc family like protein [Aduncisulcus paluster]|uniref:BPI/LBP/Plunc family like protein n=1 Tax=Aduncisulcus paluster TaxID=2918883 RepID=A0ABQ5K766_9EUKA|nr:BPI/LBP/Plunc family like protein [Aduncisulcus paluster]